LETPAFSNGNDRKLFVGIYYIFLTQFSMKNCPDSHSDLRNRVRVYRMESLIAVSIQEEENVGVHAVL